MKQKLIGVLALAYLLHSVFGIQLNAYAISSIGHFDDTSWAGLSSQSGYNDISVDINIQVWNGGADAYYYSNNAYFSNGKNIYGGLQTNGYDGSKWIGKMAIFSVWDVSSGIAEPGGSGTPFGGEGEGYSVRLPYNWSSGTTYRFKMYIDQDASSGNRLWGASVTNLTTGQTSRIGRIYVPVSYGKIHSPVTFHERYIGQTQSCNQMSPSQVKFSNMTAAGQRFSSFNHYYKLAIPDCPDAIWTFDYGDGYSSGVNTVKPTATPPSPAPVSPRPTQKTTPPPPPPEPVPAEATNPPSSDQQSELSQPQSPSTATNKNNRPYILIAAITVTIAILATSLSYLGHKKRIKALMRHFPHDFDVHGPKSIK